MINLSFNELRLTAQIRNISDYENKSKEDLMKALSAKKPNPEPKPQAPKPQTPRPETKPKPQTPKAEPKPQTPKPEIRVNKGKLKKLRKDFDELRHKFSKKVL